MSNRRLPLRPDLDQLKHQAKDLLRQFRAGDSAAVAEFAQHYPRTIHPEQAKLSDAQLVLARAYEASGWPRLAIACRLLSAIWDDDVAVVREVIQKQPSLLREPAVLRTNSNWGPPMSYAANLGRGRIVRLLHELGAADHAHALDRATLQGHVDIARLLHGWMGNPPPAPDALNNPAYTLSTAGTALMLELGAPVVDSERKRLAPVDVVLETDSRNPQAKHEILAMYVRHGLILPDTPPMALHRGRIDLLQEHLRRDPALLRRTFTHEEIFPPEMGCHDEILATCGTPLAGATLLHMAVDYDEMAIARWLLERGMNVDERAAVDADGFGGHTALFATVVSQPNFWMNYKELPQTAPFTQLLLDNGADPNARASLRKQLHPGYGDDHMHEYRNVSPLGWGRQFHRQVFVSQPAMKLIAERGGKE